MARAARHLRRTRLGLSVYVGSTGCWRWTRLLSVPKGRQPRTRVVSLRQEPLERVQRACKRNRAPRTRRSNVARTTRRKRGGWVPHLVLDAGPPLRCCWLVLKLEEARHSHSLCSQVRKYLDCRARTGSLFAPPSPSDQIRAGNQRFPRSENIDMTDRLCQAANDNAGRETLYLTDK